jgi:hypothetical protein
VNAAGASQFLISARLACCCGLHVSEIAGLRISDVRVEPSRPHIRIRRGASKGGQLVTRSRDLSKNEGG